MPKPEFVRVKSKTTGHELSMTKAAFESRKSGFELLDGKDATDDDGRPSRPKPSVSLPKATVSAPNQTKDGGTAR